MTEAVAVRFVTLIEGTRLNVSAILQFHFSESFHGYEYFKLLYSEVVDNAFISDF